MQTAPAEGPVIIRDGFRWDDCDAYLFDIDGTLLHAQGGVHTDAFSWSVEAVMGHPLSMDGVAVHGTDPGAYPHAGDDCLEVLDLRWQFMSNDAQESGHVGPIRLPCTV